jgi:hypothetical protein
MNHREAISTLEDEQAIMSHLAQGLEWNRSRSVCTGGNNKKKKYEWKLAGTPVCRTFYSQALKVSENKLKGAKKWVSGSTNPLVMKIVRQTRSHDVASDLRHSKGDTAHSFWTSFFDDCCQTPKEGERYFPVNMPMDKIFKLCFVPYCHRLGKEACCPRTFERARGHADFDEVKIRKNHHHICPLHNLQGT